MSTLTVSLWQLRGRTSEYGLTRFPLVHGIRVALQATLIGVLVSIFPYIGEVETGNLSLALVAQGS